MESPTSTTTDSRENKIYSGAKDSIIDVADNQL